MTTHISGKFGQFPYYDIQLKHPDWENYTVLDFGGNAGNILKDPNCTIDHWKYWSLDVSKDAIDRARHEFPQAHWLYYNRYNFTFNPDGVRNLALPFQDERFDVILAYSVFTHIGLEEMVARAGRTFGFQLHRPQLLVLARRIRRQQSQVAFREDHRAP